MQLPLESRDHRAFSLSLLHSSNSSNSIEKKNIALDLTGVGRLHCTCLHRIWNAWKPCNHLFLKQNG